MHLLQALDTWLLSPGIWTSFTNHEHIKMPTNFGFEVSIVSKDISASENYRTVYQEYGTNVLRSTTSQEQIVTTKIESKTDQSFIIRLTATGPLPIGPLKVLPDT